MLQIARVQKDDGGKFTCQAVNEAGEDRMHFELDILGKQAHIRVHGVVVNKTHASIWTFNKMLSNGDVYGLSPSCDHGGIRELHGGSGSRGQQLCGPSLRCDRTPSSSHLLAQRQAAGAHPLTAYNQ